MMKQKWINFILLLFSLLLCGCRKKMKKELNLAMLWNVGSDAFQSVENDQVADWASVPIFIRQQSNGFLRGIGEEKVEGLNVQDYAEGTSIEEISRQIGRIVQNDHSVMVVGSSTNADSMYAASATDYFEIPFLVPFADGNNIIGKNNSWTNMLMPTADDYTDFVESELFTDQMSERLDSFLFEDKPIISYSVTAGIFFEDSNYGHNTAVNLGLMMMDKGINLDYYKGFTDQNLKANIEKAWRDEPEKISSLDIVVFVFENATMPKKLSNVKQYWEDYGRNPLMLTIGYPLKNQFPDSVDTEDMYFVVQDLDYGNCPMADDGFFSALGYGAGSFLGKVLNNAMDALPEYGKDLGVGRRLRGEAYAEEYASLLRDQIRQKERVPYENIPCLGTVDIRSGGVNSALSLALVQKAVDGSFVKVSPDVFFNQLAVLVRQDLGLKE